MPMEKRAKIFLPFNGLRGYYDLILKADKVVEPKRELSEDELNDLSNAINQLEKGMMVGVCYYLNDGYVKIEGLVSKIDIIKRILTVVKTKINFDDMLYIKIKNC